MLELPGRRGSRVDPKDEPSPTQGVEGKDGRHSTFKW